MSTEVQAVRWDQGRIILIDQTKLPETEVYLEIETTQSLIDAIVSLAVRGAPALGLCGGYGVALAMLEGARKGWSEAEVQAAVTSLRDARPTAVNLAWAVDLVAPLMADGVERVLAAADEIARADEDANREIARHGADWVAAHVSRRPLRILTHCNTGALAASGRGTALGVIRELADRGLVELVYADETRPLLQGSRLTAWELSRAGIPHLVQADGAAASTVLRGLVDVALIGADRIAANGDTANKIGSVSVALACHAAGVPFLSVAPISTVDLSTATGDDIHIELRAGEEVTTLAGVRTAPVGTEGFNPAFDVTPAKYLTGIVTERGVIEVAAGQTPAEFLA